MMLLIGLRLIQLLTTAYIIIKFGRKEKEPPKVKGRFFPATTLTAKPVMR